VTKLRFNPPPLPCMPTERVEGPSKQQMESIKTIFSQSRIRQMTGKIFQRSFLTVYFRQKNFSSSTSSYQQYEQLGVSGGGGQEEDIFL
jgi:hypothetical protein